MPPEDVSRWLRAVRPPTAADGDWAESEQGEAALAELHSRLAPVSRGTSVARFARRRWLPISGIAVAASVVGAVTLATSAGPGSPGTPQAGGDPGSTNRPSGPTSSHVPSRPLPGIRPVAQLLTHDLSCSDLLHDLRTAARTSVTPYGLPGSFNGGYYAVGDAAGGAVRGPVPPATAPMPSMAAGPEKAATQDSAGGTTSGTNVQEVGVDEPDVVKTVGDEVISLSNGVLRVIDAATHKITSSLDLTIYAGWQDAQLFADADHAVVFLSGGYAGGGRGGPAIDYAASPDGNGAKSTALFVDLAGTPKVTGSLRVAGNYLDARMIDGTIRLVASSSPKITFEPNNGTDDKGALKKNKATIGKTPVEAWLPEYEVTAGGVTNSGHVACGAVSHPKDFTAASLLTVYTLSMKDLTADPEPVTVAADGDTVYASGGSLYLASNPNWWGGGCWDICPAGPASRSGISEKTEVHRFDITGTGRPEYLGSGSVPGRLLSSYSLSEYDGALRIATTSNQQSTSSSAVYALDAAKLTELGHVGGLGKGEQIYAVRFAEKLAYVVTFKQTDPLYVIDLADPAHPTVKGELKITGYSSYLHPVGSDRLLGVGQEASNQGRVSGMQVSLFDVSDVTDPRRTGQVVLDDVIGEGTVDPHAFLYWGPTGLVVVPADSWDQKYMGEALVLRVDGARLTKVGLVRNPDGTSRDYGTGITRSMIVDGALWTFSAGGVQVLDQKSLDQQAWIEFS
jgi:uncharacterized secreted protein with C-terminal beta-propeller domain